MKHGLFLSVLTLMLVLATGVFAQDVSQWHLPEGAIARLGKGKIKDIKYSPDGTRLTVASSVGIWLYDTETYQEVALLTQDTDSGERVVFNSVAFSPDGDTMATSSESPIQLWDVAQADTRALASVWHESPIQLWDVATGTPLRIFTNHRIFDNDDHTNIVFSSDGETLASSRGQTIHLWDVATGKQTKTLEGHARWVTRIVFSPHGDTLATASEDKTVRLWDARSGENTRTLRGHTETVRLIVFNPDGNTLASASWGDRTVRLWDADSGKNLKTLKGHKAGITSIVFSPDGRTLASASSSWHEGRKWGPGTIQLWDAHTGQNMKTLKARKWGIKSIVFSPDGRTLASASDYDIHLWDTATGIHALWNAITGKGTKTLKRPKYEISSIAFSPDGHTLASGGDDGTVRLWNAHTGKNKRTLKEYTARVDSVAFSPDGHTLASAGSDKTISLWDVATQKQIKTLDEESGYGRRRSVAFSPDGRTLASASTDDGTIRLWDTHTSTQTKTLSGHDYRVRNVVFSSDGSRLASVSYYAIICLWNARTGEKQKTLRHEGGDSDSEVRPSVAFSPDGRTLASAGYVIRVDSDGRGLPEANYEYPILLWDTATGEHTKSFKGHTYGTTSVAFSPDGGTLASGGRDGVIRLWDVATGTQINTLQQTKIRRYHNEIISVVFSPDGGTLASGGVDVWSVGGGVVRLWNVTTGTQRQVLRGHTTRVTSVAFSRDGSTLASGSWDGTVLLWDVTPLPR